MLDTDARASLSGLITSCLAWELEAFIYVGDELEENPPVTIAAVASNLTL